MFISHEQQRNKLSKVLIISLIVTNVLLPEIRPKSVESFLYSYPVPVVQVINKNCLLSLRGGHTNNSSSLPNSFTILYKGQMLKLVQANSIDPAEQIDLKSIANVEKFNNNSRTQTRKRQVQTFSGLNEEIKNKEVNANIVTGLISSSNSKHNVHKIVVIEQSPKSSMKKSSTLQSKANLPSSNRLDDNNSSKTKTLRERALEKRYKKRVQTLSDLEKRDKEVIKNSFTAEVEMSQPQIVLEISNDKLIYQQIL